MQKIDYYVLTQILIDDLYFPGLEPRKDILGGGCYTVAGMRVWSDHVGICSGVGPDFAGNYDKWFQQNGIHVAAAMSSVYDCSWSSEWRYFSFWECPSIEVLEETIEKLEECGDINVYNIQHHYIGREVPDNDQIDIYNPKMFD